MIDIVSEKIDIVKFYNSLYDEGCGGIVTFEGRIRNFNDGKNVIEIFYESYYPMAMKVMDEIRNSAIEKFKIKHLIAVHRIGKITLGEIAVWIGVAAVHRKEAFRACEFTIDEIKKRVPIWKKEIYLDGSYSWVQCHHH